MPYKNIERQKTYNRDYQKKWQARKRAENKGLPVPLYLNKPLENYRLDTVRDVIKELSDAIYLVKSDKLTNASNKARSIGYLCSIALRAIEVGELESQIISLEEKYQKLLGGKVLTFGESHGS